MSARSSIEWTATVHADGSVTPGRTWNPVTGCTKVSQGCKHCYAEGVAHRFFGRLYGEVTPAGTSVSGVPTEYAERLRSDGLLRPRRFTDVWTHDDRLLEPRRWKKPARVFVNSMSDLFHDVVPDGFLDQVFAVMGWARQHTYQVLTKRPERMRAYLTDPHVHLRVQAAGEKLQPSRPPAHWYHVSDWSCRTHPWPLPNVWLGVSVENQATADARIPLLLDTPAAVRFVSYEPAIGPVTFDNGATSWLTCHERCTGDTECPCESFMNHGACFHGIDWLIVGGESGPDARPFDVKWARTTVQQCHAAGVPVFVKQLGANVRDRNDAGFTGDEPWHWPEEHAEHDRIEHNLDGTRDGYQGAPVRIHLRDRKGGDPAEWPEDLRVREFPGARR